MTYQLVDLSNGFTAGSGTTGQGNSEHSSHDLRNEIHDEPRDVKVASDQGRETDRRIEVGSRDAEEGPCGDNERNTERERLSETATIFVISQSSRLSPKKDLSNCSPVLQCSYSACDSEIKATLFMPV